MSNLHTALSNIRARLAQGWTQGASAKDAQGCSVIYDDPQAVSWCILGALDKEVTNNNLHDEIYELIRGTAQTPYISEWNDTPDRTQEEILTLLDRAIASVKSSNA